MRRTLFIALALMVLPEHPRAQAQLQPKPEIKIEPHEVTIGDVQGKIISGVIVYSGRIRWSGDNVIRPYRQDWRFNIRIGEQASIRWTLTVTSRAGENSRTRNYNHSATIGRPDQKSEATGARAVVWAFDNSALTLLRVFEAGGRTVKIAFAPTASGLTCVASSAYAQEVGAGNPKVSAEERGGYYEFIGLKQTSSTCAVSK
jgi:hypothetical protein